MNHLVTLNLQVIRHKDGNFTPQVQYIIVDMFINYNDK